MKTLPEQDKTFAHCSGATIAACRDGTFGDAVAGSALF